MYTHLVCVQNEESVHVTQSSIMFGYLGPKFEILQNPISAAEVCLARTGVLCYSASNTGHAYVIFFSVLHQLCMVFGGAGIQNLCYYVAVYYCL